MYYMYPSEHSPQCACTHVYGISIILWYERVWVAVDWQVEW